MARSHAIRLRGPWKLEAIERDVRSGEHAASEPLPAAATVPVPGDWSATLGGDFRGGHATRGTFNRPQTSMPANVCGWRSTALTRGRSRASTAGQVGHVAGHQAAARFDITPLLELHNILSIEVSLSAAAFHDAATRGDRAGQPGGLTGEVRLEMISGD